MLDVFMKETAMKILWLGLGVLGLCLAFAAGLEIGHRHGYDSAWVECKFDAKQTISTSKTIDAFWQWHGKRSASCIRQHRSFWFY